MRYLCLLVPGMVPAYAISVSSSTLSSTANEQTCQPGPDTNVYQAMDRQVFLWFLAHSVGRGETVRIDWIDPRGQVALSTPFAELPAAGSMCFLTPLPVAGFDAAEQAGQWRVRVEARGALLLERKFEIQSAGESGIRIRSVERRPVGANEMELAIEGSGFEPESVVNLAGYSEVGGWRYLDAILAPSTDGRRIRIRRSLLPPAEYILMVRNPDGRSSPPARLVLAASGGYKLPIPAGQPWTITQGPFGSFSHFNRSLHAWDIAPLTSRCVVAMRGGVVHAFDLGLANTPHVRSFGNYITIAHDNGEFSHYGHLRTGAFLVKTGQRVEQGQAIATAGNSGFALGPGGGYHVHAHVTQSFSISSQSIPFRFEDLAPGRKLGAVVSSNSHPQCDCRQSPPHGRNTTGEVAAGGWWSQAVNVGPGVTALEVVLDWPVASADLDLHLMSPGGRHYGWYGDSRGYSGEGSNPESFRVASPEAGAWRVWVYGRGNGGRFTVGTTVRPGVTAAALRR